MTGLPPKPHSLKVLNGFPGKRGKKKQNLKPLTFTEGRPDCPDWLDAIAKDEWERVVSELEAKGMLMKIDRFLVAAYCEYFSEWWILRKKIKKAGRTYNSSKVAGQKMIRPNPDIKIANDAFKNARQLISDLSLSPSARARLTDPVEPTNKDPLEELLSGKKKKK